ncbi:MAG: hypothetical protein JWP82_2407 [Humibacillus sp.]|nr:hypothetical protein [Humibacillus sp.]
MRAGGAVGSVRSLATVAALALVSALAACTSSTGAPNVPSRSPVVATPAPSATTPGPSAATSAAIGTTVDPTPDPLMTPVDSRICAEIRDVPAARSPLPAAVIWPVSARSPVTTGGADVVTEVVPGADVARCRADREPRPRDPRAELGPLACDTDQPWIGAPSDRYVVAGEASRELHGESVIANDPAPMGGAEVVDRQSVRWGSLEVPTGDPNAALTRLARAARECAGATPRTVAGRPALVGSVRSDYRQGPATLVLLLGRAAAWLTLDGTTATPETEVVRIVRLGAARLLPAQTSPAKRS